MFADISKLKQSPPELSQSGVVKKNSMSDLDLACVSKAKFSHEAIWFYSGSGKETLGRQLIYGTQVGFLFSFRWYQLNTFFSIASPSKLG